MVHWSSSGVHGSISSTSHSLDRGSNSRSIVFLFFVYFCLLRNSLCYYVYNSSRGCLLFSNNLFDSFFSLLLNFLNFFICFLLCFLEISYCFFLLLLFSFFLFNLHDSFISDNTLVLFLRYFIDCRASSIKCFISLDLCLLLLSGCYLDSCSQDSAEGVILYSDCLCTGCQEQCDNKWLH